MAKYAIKHKHGFLVESVGQFIDVAGGFKTAMTFSSQEAAQKTADYLNTVTRKAGAQGNCYSVCTRSQYKKPDFLKKPKKQKSVNKLISAGCSFTAKE